MDLIAVSIFVAIGRSAHGHSITLTGFLSTAWPFATGLLLGWITPWARRSSSSLAQGVLILSATVGVGMALRVISGQGTAVAFVFVALGFLGAAMVGWRSLVGLHRHARRNDLLKHRTSRVA
jgi:hypothetical protein